jgi:hypothetical protein
VIDGRVRKTRGHLRAPQQWEVFIPNHDEGYITWEQYMQNQQQIEANAGWSGRLQRATGAPKKGPALLAGLMRAVCADGHYTSSTASLRAAGCRAMSVAAIASSARYSDAWVSEARGSIKLSWQKCSKPFAPSVSKRLWTPGIKVRTWKMRKQRALKLALEKARYEANRIELLGGKMIHLNGVFPSSAIL